jgi:hypothetical protein
MTNTSSGARRALTRVLAAAALLAIYCVSTVAVTGVMMTSGVTSAQARGWGGRGGRGWGGGRGRGWGGRGRGRHWACRHNGYTSGRHCFWAW